MILAGFICRLICQNRRYLTALAVMGNRSDAEDVVQEVFLRVYEKAPQFESEEHEKAWLIRVTVTLCNSRLHAHNLIKPIINSCYFLLEYQVVMKSFISFAGITKEYLKLSKISRPPPKTIPAISNCLFNKTLPLLPKLS